MTDEGFQEYDASDAGYCTHCKEVTRDSCVEPDAEKYECPVCRNFTVMGMQQAAMLGHISFEGD